MISISSIPMLNVFSKTGNALLSWAKSYYRDRKKLALAETKNLIKLKEDVKQYLFYIIHNINLEGAYFEMTDIYQIDSAHLKTELLKDLTKARALCKTSLFELEKIITIKETCFQEDFIKAASITITKVKYRSWEHYMQGYNDMHGSLERLGNEVKFLLKHEITKQTSKQVST